MQIITQFSLQLVPPVISYTINTTLLARKKKKKRQKNPQHTARQFNDTLFTFAYGVPVA